MWQGSSCTCPIQQEMKVGSSDWATLNASCANCKPRAKYTVLPHVRFPFLRLSDASVRGVPPMGNAMLHTHLGDNNQGSTNKYIKYLVSWLSGKSLKLLPPDVTPNSIPGVCLLVHGQSDVSVCALDRVWHKRLSNISTCIRMTTSVCTAVWLQAKVRECSLGCGLG